MSHKDGLAAINLDILIKRLANLWGPVLAGKAAYAGRVMSHAVSVSVYDSTGHPKYLLLR